MSRLEDAAEAQRRRMELLMEDLKPLIPYFEKKNTTDIFVYGSGNVSVEDFKEGVYNTDIVLSVNDRMRIINGLASISNTPIDKWEKPTLESIIPKYNIRTTAIIDPWLLEPQIVFRKPPDEIYTLEDYVKTNRLSKEQYDKILLHLEKRSNIVISGGTGSGKTSFINALLDKIHELRPEDRLYIIEDVPELQCKSIYKTQVCIRKEQAVYAIETAFRWKPKRIIFGEIRSGVMAAELLEAWISGHPGNFTTIHANNAASAIERFKGLLRQVIFGTLPDLSWYIQLIVHISSKPDFGPVVTEVSTFEEISGVQ